MRVYSLVQECLHLIGQETAEKGENEHSSFNQILRIKTATQYTVLRQIIPEDELLLASCTLYIILFRHVMLNGNAAK